MSELETRPEQEPNPVVTQPELPGAPAIPVHAPAATAARAPAATFIFLTVALDMLALGMIAPVLPRLVEGFVHGNASSAARVIGLFGTLFAAMQFVFSPILGSLSDRFGRRPIVLLSNFGMGIDYLVMAWAPALPWLYLGRIVSGLTASSIPTAMAYMADVTPPEKRAGAFGMMNAAFGLGFVLGPALGGILGQVNPRLPFIVAACLSLLNGMYGLVRPAGVAHAGQPGPLLVAPRQPGRLTLHARPHRLAPASLVRPAHRLPGPAGADERLRHLHRLPLPLVRSLGRPVARSRRHLHHRLRRLPRPPRHRQDSASAAPSCSDSPAEPLATSAAATRAPACCCCSASPSSTS